MSRLLLLNIILAFTWTLFADEPNLSTWLGGLIFGGIVIIIFTKEKTDHIYFRAPFIITRLFFVFWKELIMANISVASIVLRRKIEVEPGFIAYPLRVQKNWQITLLASLITLTPGTLSVDVSQDRKYLLIHVLHIDDSQQIKEGIYESFERYILEVSQS